MVNVIVALGDQLRGTRCRPTTDDIAVRTRIRSVRRPDVTVECAALIRDGYEAHEPKLVVEVLSPSTTNIDRFRKLEEYKQHPTLAYVLLIDTRKPTATLYTRAGERDWQTENFAGLDATIALPEIAVELGLREVYEDLSFADSSDPG